MATKDGQCNCLVGTAVFDADGNCLCIESPVSRNVGPLGRMGQPAQRPVINNYYLTGGQAGTPAAESKTEPDAEDDNTIFGFHPLVALGAAAAGLWILSSMGEKGGKK